MSVGKKNIEIVKGIKQAALKAFVDTPGEKPFEIKGRITAKDLNDGFKVGVTGNVMSALYMVKIQVRELHDLNFENEKKIIFANYISWLKDEYNKVTGKILSLKTKDEPKVTIESIGHNEKFCRVTGTFIVNGIKVDTKGETEIDKSNLDIFSKNNLWHRLLEK